MTQQSGGGGGSPVGPASGVLGGTYPGPTFSTNGTDAILASRFNQLAAPVTMTNADTLYDGPSVLVSPGTWLLFATLTLQGLNAVVSFSGVIWDGATGFSGTETALLSSSAFNVSLSLVARVTPLINTTYRAAAVSTGAGCSIRAVVPNNIAGNIASTILALRVA